MRIRISEKMCSTLLELYGKYRRSGNKDRILDCHHMTAWALFNRDLIYGGSKPDTVILSEVGIETARLIDHMIKAEEKKFREEMEKLKSGEAA